MTQVWPSSDHIFAPLSRIDLKLVPIDRSRRDTSENTIYVLNLARNKIVPEDFMIFWENLSKFSENVGKFFENLEIL